MKQYRTINNIVGWVVFAIAAVVYCMTIEYDKLRHENEAEYVKRCQELRIKELAKADLEIQYKLSN